MVMQIQTLSIEQVGGDGDLIVTARMPISVLAAGASTSREHRIVVPRAALASRRRLYGLDDEQNALAAILKEHATRLNALPDDEHPDPRVRDLGGLRNDIHVELSRSVAAVLSQATELPSAD